MEKCANNMTTSELIYYINEYNPNFEKRKEMDEFINYRLKQLYKFNDDEIKLLKYIEITKFKERGQNLDNYLFSYNLTGAQKLKKIYELYKNDELHKLSLDEQAIAINLMLIVEDHYLNKRKRAITKGKQEDIDIADYKYKVQVFVLEEILDNYKTIVINKEKSTRFRYIYLPYCTPTKEEETSVKQMLKSKKSSY